MGLLLALTAGLIVLVVLWALGTNALDASFILGALLIGAIVVRLVSPHLPGNRPD
jgi:hypothetical protein